MSVAKSVSNAELLRAKNNPLHREPVIGWVGHRDAPLLQCTLLQLIFVGKSDWFVVRTDLQALTSPADRFQCHTDFGGDGTIGLLWIGHDGRHGTGETSAGKSGFWLGTHDRRLLFSGEAAHQKREWEPPGGAEWFCAFGRLPPVYCSGQNGAVEVLILTHGRWASSLGKVWAWLHMTADPP